jgi:Flp pilus assembly protein TadG
MLSSLAADPRGATIVEFAIVAPVMIALLMGLGDLLYQSYLQSILDGAVQKAGRDSSLEASATSQTALDDKVEAMVKTIAKQATVSYNRRSYSTFALIKPEYFVDTNNDGVRQPTECFDDTNSNKQWDADPGRVSQGGANDVTRYTVTAVYPRLFPVAKLLGFASTGTLTSTTLLKNQPYKTQTGYSIVRVCP